MSAFSKINVKDKDLTASLQSFFKILLKSDQIDALLVPWHLPAGGMVMPTLITDLNSLEAADPLAPCFPMSAAKIASKLTKQKPGRTIGLVMRPCEIRAFVELSKLKQGSFHDVVLISVDCLGAYANKDYAALSREDPRAFSTGYAQAVLDGQAPPFNGVDIAGACRICEHPVSAAADINIALFGMDYQNEIGAEAVTAKGEAVISALSVKKGSEPPGRKKAIDALVSERITRRDEVFKATAEATSSIEKMSAYLSRCVNCYNCRVACPVCYCRECVFVTDVFDHDASQYVNWADKKGKVKMPTDTDFFHLTRLTHIGLTCVGCGQCSNACPNDIPLMELFRTVSFQAQADFDYEAGRDADEPIPFAVFNENEYEEVVGIKTVAAK